VSIDDSSDALTRYKDTTENNALRLAGLTIYTGINSLRAGLGVVSARLDNGTLRIVEGRCPNLLAEAELYRYSEAAGNRRDENTVDEHNHALPPCAT
jgi:hypothetical protein